MYVAHPNREPRKVFVEPNFFSASAISCNAFCSLSAILLRLYSMNKHNSFSMMMMICHSRQVDTAAYW